MIILIEWLHSLNEQKSMRLKPRVIDVRFMDIELFLSRVYVAKLILVQFHPRNFITRMPLFQI